MAYMFIQASSLVLAFIPQACMCAQVSVDACWYVTRAHVAARSSMHARHLNPMLSDCAAPSRRGGVLQWGRPEGNMRRPGADVPETSATPAELENAWAAAGEDADAAPACEWTDGKKVRALSCCRPLGSGL